MPKLANMAMPAFPPASSLPAVICIAGATGSGKSALALEIAAEFDCEVVNADSRQLYSDFPLITAQPGLNDRAICPHHIYGILQTRDKPCAGQWSEIAAKLCRQIGDRGKIPLVVGGTGFYFEALLNGLASIPAVSSEIGSYYAELMERNGSERMHMDLAIVDPDYAAKVHPRDKQRIQRALEVFAATGNTFTWWHKNMVRKPLAIGPLFVISADLQVLTPALATRIDQMLANGAMEEARNAWERCPDPGAPGWSGIGCSEALAYIHGKIGLAECRRQWLANTRAYAKRQITWFRGRKNTCLASRLEIAELVKRRLAIWDSRAAM